MTLNRIEIDAITDEFECTLEEALKIYLIQENELLIKYLGSQVYHFDEHVERIASAIRDVARSLCEMEGSVAELSDKVIELTDVLENNEAK